MLPIIEKSNCVPVLSCVTIPNIFNKECSPNSFPQHHSTFDNVLYSNIITGNPSGMFAKPKVTDRASGERGIILSSVTIRPDELSVLSWCSPVVVLYSSNV